MSTHLLAFNEVGLASPGGHMAMYLRRIEQNAADALALATALNLVASSSFVSGVDYANATTSYTDIVSSGSLAKSAGTKMVVTGTVTGTYPTPNPLPMSIEVTVDGVVIPGGAVNVFVDAHGNFTATVTAKTAATGASSAVYAVRGKVGLAGQSMAVPAGNATLQVQEVHV